MDVDTVPTSGPVADTAASASLAAEAAAPPSPAASTWEREGGGASSAPAATGGPSGGGNGCSGVPPRPRLDGEGEACLSSDARAQQLSQRVAHLEADLAFLQRRKAQLERENEALAAAAAQRPDLEARLREALATGALLEAECRRHRAEGVRREELEEQQADIARSFSELQGVVSQLVRRLSEINAQHARLSEEKGAAEAAAAALRVELQKWRSMRTSTTASVPGHGHGHGTVGRGANVAHGRSHSRAFSSCGGPCRGCPTCRLRCRVDPSRPLTGTPPRRGFAALQRGGYQPQQPSYRSGIAGGHGDGCANGGVGSTNSSLGPSAPTTLLELAEAKVECEQLRQRLVREEQACAEARQGRAVTLQESGCAEVKTADLQSELREFPTATSARDDHEAGSCLEPRSASAGRAAT
uniref:Uncharacterized protein n=1 Tax=Pyrodinium bahamense TaxID=73915 RepID=A0A7R9ZUH5_9DINO